jgi:hypothetical protein
MTAEVLECADAVDAKWPCGSTRTRASAVRAPFLTRHKRCSSGGVGGGKNWKATLMSDAGFYTATVSKR